MKDWEKIVATIAAAACLCMIFYLLWRNEDVSPNLVVMVRAVMALAGGIFGATIPGIVNVRWDAGGFAIRAGGALALFVIIFFGSPTVLPPPEQKPDAVIGPGSRAPALSECWVTCAAAAELPDTTTPVHYAFRMDGENLVIDTVNLYRDLFLSGRPLPLGIGVFGERGHIYPSIRVSVSNPTARDLLVDRTLVQIIHFVPDNEPVLWLTSSEPWLTPESPISFVNGGGGSMYFTQVTVSLFDIDVCEPINGDDFERFYLEGHDELWNLKEENLTDRIAVLEYQRKIEWFTKAEFPTANPLVVRHTDLGTVEENIELFVFDGGPFKSTAYCTTIAFEYKTKDGHARKATFFGSIHEPAGSGGGIGSEDTYAAQLDPSKIGQNIVVPGAQRRLKAGETDTYQVKLKPLDLGTYEMEASVFAENRELRKSVVVLNYTPLKYPSKRSVAPIELNDEEFEALQAERLENINNQVWQQIFPRP
ncbi:hypothetical protein [Mesorhizobium sp. IMUNJ 23232]|uniref:hypothetical protein n=1 Tax=Mesorhizobium sp. IMUNJ 23232 TaxID=3376064 RepID=UPI0037A0A4BE